MGVSSVLRRGEGERVMGEGGSGERRELKLLERERERDSRRIGRAFSL